MPDKYINGAKKQTIFRRKLVSKFTLVPDDIHDLDLSDFAFRVQVYLIGRPFDWQVITDQLAQKFRCRRKKVWAALNELIAARLMRRWRLADGTMLYHVFDEPHSQKGREAIDEPHSQKGREAPTLPKRQAAKKGAYTNTERVTYTDSKERSVIQRGQRLRRSSPSTAT